MKIFKRWLLPLFLGMLLGAVMGALGIRYLRSRRLPPPLPAAVTVNGEALSMESFVNNLKLRAGSQLLQQLVEQKLVEQEALKRKVTLPPAEVAELDKAAQAISIPELREAALTQARVALLARHLLLEGVSEADKRQVYDFYKPELVQYEIFVVVLGTKKDGRDLARSLEDGVSFALLAKNFSLDPSSKQGGRLGFLTLPQIRRWMGDEAADSVARMKPNTVGTTLYSRHGLIVIKLGEVRSSYEQLKSVCEGILAESRRVELMQSLISSAKISSPYLQASPSAVPEGELKGIVPPGQGELPDASAHLPKPVEGKLPPAQSLPPPQ